MCADQADTRPLLSDRGIALYCDGGSDLPVLTVENYMKWYNLYVIYPDYRVAKFEDTLDSEVAFVSEYNESAYGDHVFNPRFYLFLAKRYGMDFSDSALEVLIGRWLLEHSNVDFSVPNDNAHVVKRLVQRSKCKHCGQPIRKIIRGCEFVNIWVHDDPDEDPDAEDYGWIKCLPNADGSFETAEPNAAHDGRQEKTL